MPPASAVVREDALLPTVEPHGPAVGEDPLRPGVAEGDTDADDRVGVVGTHRVHHDLDLLAPGEGTLLLGARGLLVVGGGGAGEHDAGDHAEDSPFAEGADDVSDLRSGCQALRGLEQQNAAPQVVDGGEPADVAVLTLEPGVFRLWDSRGVEREADDRLRCLLTVRQGRLAFVAPEVRVVGV